MRRTRKSEIQRLNDEIVGYLLLNRSPPRELLAARDEALAGLGEGREAPMARRFPLFRLASGARTHH